jgi:MFS family permease
VAWDPKYEFKAVGLLALGFGMVGLDRFIINPLFPVMQKELGLNYQDLGLISAVLALAWGVASIFSGRLSDRVGRKRCSFRRWLSSRCWWLPAAWRLA